MGVIALAAILHASWVRTFADCCCMKQYFRPDAPSALFDYDGPLGTFASKILTAYGLGIFGSNTNHDLLLIRTIRNEFAHCQLPLRFDLPVVKAMCDHLLLPDNEQVRAVPSYFWSLPDEKPNSWFDEGHPKTRFVTGCYTIIFALLEYRIEPLSGEGGAYETALATRARSMCLQTSMTFHSVRSAVSQNSSAPIPASIISGVTQT